MKTKLTNFLSLTLALCMLLTAMPVTASAATIKLNKTKVTLYVGQKVKLKVSGTKEKVTWKSDDKSVATVNAKGKVTGKSEGSANITAKVSKQTLTCAVTVKSDFSSKDAVKKIECDLHDTGNGVVAILTNNNPCDVSIEAKMVYYDESGRMLQAISGSNYCLGKSQTCALRFIPPYDSDYEPVDYSDYKINMSIEKSFYKSYSDKIDIISDIGIDNVTVEVTNNSGKVLDSVQIAIVFYDDFGEIIGYEIGYADCDSPGSADYISLDFPHDEYYDTIYPADYEIFVNDAYNY